MKLVGLWVGLLLIGCQTAQPQPEWTPPQAQLLSEGKKEGRYSENDRENLTVGGLPKLRPTPTAQPVAVKLAPALNQPHLPDEQVPNGVAYRHSQNAPPPEVASDVVPGDVPLVSASEESVLEAVAETGVDNLGGDGQGHIVFVSVDITPKGPQIPAGCDLALLVDVSGSIFHTDMDSAVRATSEIYGQQGAGNRTWLIAFGSGAQMLVDGLSSVPSPAEISKLLRGSREAGGGTQLTPALVMGQNGLRKSNSVGKARHMVVVSDGMLGDTSEALRVAEQGWKSDGISCSAIQVGHGSGGTLEGLAQSCNGQYVAAENMAGAGQLLKSEASKARSIVLRDLRLQASLAAGVTIRRAFQVEPVHEVATSGTQQETLNLGDIHRNEKRRILLELQVKPGAGRERALAWLSVLSKGADAKERPPQVLPQVRVGNTNKKPATNPAVDRMVDAVYRVVSRK